MERRSRRGRPPGAGPADRAFDFQVGVVTRIDRATWLDPAGEPRVGPSLTVRFVRPDRQIDILVQQDVAGPLAAVGLAAWAGPPLPFPPDDRPIDLFLPATRPPAHWQAPLILHLPDPASGRLRRRFLGRSVQLKEIGLTEVLAELERWRIKLVLHERAVDPPRPALRGRLVALIPEARPTALAVLYLATRIYPALAAAAQPPEQPDPARPAADAAPPGP